jgi:hypothetical protein
MLGCYMLMEKHLARKERTDNEVESGGAFPLFRYYQEKAQDRARCADCMVRS